MHFQSKCALCCFLLLLLVGACDRKPSSGVYGRLVQLPRSFYEDDWVGFTEAGSEWYRLRLAGSTGSLAYVAAGELETHHIIDWQVITNASDNYIVCRFANSADDLAPSNMVGTVTRFGISATFKSFGGYSDACEFRRLTNVVENFKLLGLEVQRN
jgi:hypothetical protein